MAIALRKASNGRLQQFQTGETLSIDRIERLSGSGNIQIGASLGPADELQLGSATDLSRVMGDFVVAGQVDAALNMGGNAINHQDYTEVTPTALAAQANNYDPTSFGTSHILRQDLTGSQSITGFAAPAGADNERFIIVNIDGGTDVLTLVSESTSSTAANRIAGPNGHNLILNPGEAAHLTYDSTSSRWRAIAYVTTPLFSYILANDGSFVYTGDGVLVERAS